MRVLFVSHSSVLEAHQHKLRILATKHGVEVHLVTPSYWYEGGVRVDVYRGNKELRYIQPFTPVFKNRLFHLYYGVPGLVRRVAPDIVHVEEEPFMPVCWQFLSAARRHDARTLFFTWENVDPPRNSLYAHCDRSCIAHADAVIAGNEDAKSILLRKGCTVPVSVIPQYGVTLEDFLPRPIAHPEGTVQIAYVGRIIPEKGIETLLAAAPGVQNARIHIAGTGEARYVERIRRLAVDLGLADRVEFHGHISRDAMPEFLSRMHVLVLPSLTTRVWKEQFGRVLIEAMAARVAVVGSDSGEIGHVLDGGAGLVFREGDARDLREKLSSLITLPGRFETLVENGYAKAASRYTNEAIADAIHGIYTSLLQ